MTHFSLYPLSKNPKNATLYLNTSMPCLEHEPEELYPVPKMAETWFERILQSPFNNVILYFIRVVNRPIEDVMVEYDKTLLSGRHIHSLFDLILHATCMVLLYSVLSCTQCAPVVAAAVKHSF